MRRARKQGNIILFWGSLYTKKIQEYHVAETEEASCRATNRIENGLC